MFVASYLYLSAKLDYILSWKTSPTHNHLVVERSVKTLSLRITHTSLDFLPYQILSASECLFLFTLVSNA